MSAASATDLSAVDEAAAAALLGAYEAAGGGRLGVACGHGYAACARALAGAAGRTSAAVALSHAKELGEAKERAASLELDLSDGARICDSNP